MFSMRSCNYITALAGLCIGAAIMAASAVFPTDMTEQGPGPGFWPFLLGAALTGAAGILAGYTFLHRAILTEDKVPLNTAANRQAYMMMGIIGIFALLIPLIGFYPAAFLLVPCVMYRLDYRDKKWIAGTTVGVTVFIYVVFGQLLHTALPVSVFWR